MSWVIFKRNAKVTTSKKQDQERPRQNPDKAGCQQDGGKGEGGLEGSNNNRTTA